VANQAYQALGINQEVVKLVHAVYRGLEAKAGPVRPGEGLYTL